MQTIQQTGQAYGAMLSALAAAERKAEDIRSYYEQVGITLLTGPGAPDWLFTTALADYGENIRKELLRKDFQNSEYCEKLYDPAAREYELADVIADLAFAQLERKPNVTGSKDTDEREQAIAFVLSVYTVFSLLVNPKLSAGDFSRIFRRSWDNYFLNDISRTVRNHYDKNWYGKYNPRNTFYPLG